MGYEGRGSETDIYAMDAEFPAWTLRGRIAVGSVRARSTTHDLLPAYCHAIVYKQYIVEDTGSLEIQDNAKLVIFNG